MAAGQSSMAAWGSARAPWVAWCAPVPADPPGILDTPQGHRVRSPVLVRAGPAAGTGAGPHGPLNAMLLGVIVGMPASSSPCAA